MKIRRKHSKRKWTGHINLYLNLSLTIINEFFPQNYLDSNDEGITQYNRLPDPKPKFVTKKNDARAYCGAECGSDYHLVIAKEIVNYRHLTHLTEEICWHNLESFKQESFQFLYKLRLATKLQEVSSESTHVDRKYQLVNNLVRQTATEALGCQDTNKKKTQRKDPEWLSDKLEDCLKLKNCTIHGWRLMIKNTVKYIYDIKKLWQHRRDMGE